LFIQGVTLCWCGHSFWLYLQSYVICTHTHTHTSHPQGQVESRGTFFKCLFLLVPSSSSPSLLSCLLLRLSIAPHLYWQQLDSPTSSPPPFLSLSYLRINRHTASVGRVLALPRRTREAMVESLLVGHREADETCLCPSVRFASLGRSTRPQSHRKREREYTHTRTLYK